MRRYALLPIFAAAGLLAAGCSSPPPGSSPPEPRLGAPTPALVLPGIEGRIRYTGPLTDIVVPADPRFPHCVEGSAGQLRLGPDGGLEGVLVHLPGAPVEPAGLRVVAAGCRFAPSTAIVPVGSVLTVVNDDPLLQTFHLRRQDGVRERPVQNLAVAPGSAPLTWTLDRAGRYRVVSVERPWMESWIQVIDSGIGLRSGPEGRFAAPLPPGELEVSTWHPLLGLRRHGVTVPADGPASLYVDWSELAEDARAPKP